MQKNAEPVQSLTIPDGVRVVALGEASHGNSEFQQIKLDVIKLLVENEGVKAFALEGDFGGCEMVNRYIHGGAGTAEEAAANIGFAIHRTEKMAALISYMREYNETAPEHSQGCGCSGRSDRRGGGIMDTKELQQKVLDLAIRRKLVTQDPNDEPASVLLERIRQQKQQMVRDGKLKAKDIKNDTVIFVSEDNANYVYSFYNLYFRELLPPFSRYRCSVRISSALRRSCKARWTVDSESVSSLAMVGMDGQQIPALLALADR